MTVSSDAKESLEHHFYALLTHRPLASGSWSMMSVWDGDGNGSSEAVKPE